MNQEQLHDLAPFARTKPAPRIRPSACEFDVNDEERQAGQARDAQSGISVLQQAQLISTSASTRAWNDNRFTSMDQQCRPILHQRKFDQSIQSGRIGFAYAFDPLPL
jgi:hypothetical protein